MNTWVVKIRYKNKTTHHIIFGEFTEDYLIAFVEKTMNVVCIDYFTNDYGKMYITTQDNLSIEVDFEPIHSFSFANSDADEKYMHELKEKVIAETFADTLHYLISIRG